MATSTCRMLSNRLFCKYKRHILLSPKNRRNFLSESYSCREEWDSRLKTNVLQKVDAEEFAVHIQDQFEKLGVVKAVDMDIFVNKLSEVSSKQIDFALSLLNKFRYTNESLESPPSTSHAVVRELLDLHEYDKLWAVLNEKISYGVFLDHYCVNLLLDYFLKKEMYKEAALVAYDQMLQEDFSHPISRALSWYACHKRWKGIDISSAVTAEDEAGEGGNEEVNEEDEEEEEEVKVIKVKYIQNPWYDDHFDIPKESMLLGKTMTMLGRTESNLWGRSYLLIGWGLYEKFGPGLELMQKWAESDEKLAVSQEAVNDFHSRLSSMETKEVPEEKDPGSITVEDLYPYVTAEQKALYLEQFQEHQGKLQSAGKIVEELDFESILLANIKKATAQNEQTDITGQKILYDSWSANRLEMVEAQIADIKRAARIKEVTLRLIKIREIEIRLSYFDQKQKIRLMKRRGKRVEELDALFKTDDFVHWAPRI